MLEGQQKKSGNIFRVCIVLDCVRLTTRVPVCPMGRTCGEPNEIDLTAAQGLLTAPFQGHEAAREKMSSGYSYKHRSVVRKGVGRVEVGH